MPAPRRGPLCLTVPSSDFPSQIEPVELGIAPFETGQDSQCLIVVRKAAEPRHLGVQRLLAGMAERGVAEIVSERQSFGEVFVETERAADRPRDLRHFEAMGQPRPIVVALVIDKDLRLMGEPPKRGRVDDAVAVALKRGPRWMLGLRIKPPA